LLKSYFDLKQFLIKTEELLGKNEYYKEIKSEACLYALGKFNATAARAFYTNDYFTDIVGKTEIEFSEIKLKAELLNQINNYLLLQIGANKEELSETETKNTENIPTKLSKIKLHNNDYYFYGNLNKINKLYIEQLENEANNQFNIELLKIDHKELFILVRNLLTYLGYLQPIEYKYTQENKAFFHQNGYLVIDNFIDKVELKNLRKITYQLAALEKERNEAYLYGEGSKAQRIYNLIGKSKFYREFLLNKKIVELLENEFNRNTLHSKYYLSSFQANILYPGAKSQVLHTDLAIPEPLPSWIIRININLLLDDFTEENGATIVIPGSHKYLHKPDPDLNSNKMIKLIAPAGSLVVWTGHLWHKSGENTSSSTRAALLACFAASHFREICAEENYLLINQNKLTEFEPKIFEMIGGNHGIKKGNF